MAKHSMYSAAEAPLLAHQKRARKPTNLGMCLSPKLNGTNAPILYDLANISNEAPRQVVNWGYAQKKAPAGAGIISLRSSLLDRTFPGRRDLSSWPGGAQKKAPAAE